MIVCLRVGHVELEIVGLDGLKQGIEVLFSFVPLIIDATIFPIIPTREGSNIESPPATSTYTTTRERERVGLLGKLQR